MLEIFRPISYALLGTTIGLKIEILDHGSALIMDVTIVLLVAIVVLGEWAMRTKNIKKREEARLLELRKLKRDKQRAIDDADWKMTAINNRVILPKILANINEEYQEMEREVNARYGYELRHNNKNARSLIYAFTSKCSVLREAITRKIATKKAEFKSRVKASILSKISSL